MRNKISKRLLISISFIICHISFSFAQEVRISGTVTDSSGPVMLCNVVEVEKFASWQMSSTNSDKRVIWLRSQGRVRERVRRVSDGMPL